mmetsp:Transcript_9763/g.28658  ORF Transcript_9763/g.28658 Transcript_9763/m.28658 type:complete len:236 (-) Transcript_9763:528-1235(-)
MEPGSSLASLEPAASPRAPSSSSLSPAKSSRPSSLAKASAEELAMLARAKAVSSAIIASLPSRLRSQSSAQSLGSASCAASWVEHGSEPPARRPMQVTAARITSGTVSSSARRRPRTPRSTSLSLRFSWPSSSSASAVHAWRWTSCGGTGCTAHHCRLARSASPKPAVHRASRAAAWARASPAIAVAAYTLERRSVASRSSARRLSHCAEPPSGMARRAARKSAAPGSSSTKGIT